MVIKANPPMNSEEKALPAAHYVAVNDDDNEKTYIITYNLIIHKFVTKVHKRITIFLYQFSCFPYNTLSIITSGWECDSRLRLSNSLPIFITMFSDTYIAVFSKNLIQILIGMFVIVPTIRVWRALYYSLSVIQSFGSWSIRVESSNQSAMSISIQQRPRLSFLRSIFVTFYWEFFIAVI